MNTMNFMKKAGILRTLSVVLLGGMGMSAVNAADRGDAPPPGLWEDFVSPPDAARPGVYWYFMDGNQDRECMTADLESMHRAGLRKALFLEVNIGVPRGPVDFMSEPWQENFAHAVRTADRLGMEIILGTGPGWAGAGGPWVDPARSMQHLRASSVHAEGPGPFTGKLPVPAPREPTAFAGLSPELAGVREQWHADVAVLAFPTPAKTEPPDLLDVKALYETQPYSIWKHVPRFIPSLAQYPEPAKDAVIDPSSILDLTGRLRPDGTLDWDVPPGDWTVMRFAARNNSVTSRPAPTPGHGFETDKFSAGAFAHHFQHFHQKLLEKTGPRRPGRGWTALHLDSWESSSQNWSAAFREEFTKRRGYDPQPYFPAYTGLLVGLREATERFLWDLRITARDLLLENHALAIKRHAHENGMYYSSQFYDMNPAGDLDLGAVADVPSCEFWNESIDSVYSCVEGASIAHTMGRPVLRAEAFTAMSGYHQNPADLKNQTDWAFAMGINDFIFHTFQHQPLGLDGPKPGMAMGTHGINWHRNQTFWPMVGPYHDYIARCGQMLRQGVSVVDVLYLTPEGAPHIFMPPDDAMLGAGILREKKSHGFDAVSPNIFMERAQAEGGRITFPGGTSYRAIVLAENETMTPELLAKIEKLVRDGITVIGNPPRKSPSLSGYPQCDGQVASLADKIWGAQAVPAQVTERPYGKGRIVWGGAASPRRPDADPASGPMYPSYESTVALLRGWGESPPFESEGPLRHHQRRTDSHDIFFVANREANPADAVCTFRTDGAAPELWDPVTGMRRPLPDHAIHGDTVSLPLRFAAHESHLIVFDREAPRGSATQAKENFTSPRILATLDGPYQVTFNPAWGGPKDPVTFDPLIPWNSHHDQGIRYYSGEATYQKTFDQPAGIAESGRVFLDLGVVHKLARVNLNGEDLGIVWTPPYRLDVTGKLRPSANQLEVTVVNTWVNRLIGDQRPADKDARKLTWENGMLEGRTWNAGRYTFTTAPGVNADSPLLDSGLWGDITLQAEP